MSLINKVTEEETNDSLRALAFAIMIKAGFVSSTFKDATTTSLMSSFHLKHDTLKKALRKALEMGLVSYVYRTDKNGKQHADLRANKFNKEGLCTLKLNVCTSDYGRKVYIHTNCKDLHKQHKEATSYQSINEVMDLLITAKALFLFKRHNKMIDCQLRQACLDLSENKKIGKKMYASAKALWQYEKLYREIQNEIPAGTINALNCGFSLGKMLESFGPFVSRYKLRELLHQANQSHDHLFKVWKNVSYIDQTDRIKGHAPGQPMEKPVNPSVFELFEYAYYDPKVEGMRAAYRERFIDTNEYGEVINLHDTRGFFIAKNRKRCLAMPMANTYWMQCEPFATKGRKRRKTKRVVKATEYKYPVVVSNPSVHVTDAILPY